MSKYDSTVLLNKTPAAFMENAFLDGSILGNGRVGVAILGAISNEQILFFDFKFPNCSKQIVNHHIHT